VNASSVLDILDLLDRAALCYWIDGGWGVDALLGVESRPHSDLDLVIARSDLESALALMRDEGLGVFRDWLPNAIALRDAAGRELDLHPVDLTSDGGGDQILLDGESTWHYSAPVGRVIGGRAVSCCPAEDKLRNAPTAHGYPYGWCLGDRAATRRRVKVMTCRSRRDHWTSRRGTPSSSW